MALDAILLAFVLAPFHWLSLQGPYAFAAALCASYFLLSGAFSMHPAVCGRIFGPQLEFVAIGIVGSSDVVNNLLIGLAPILCLLRLLTYVLVTPLPLLKFHNVISIHFLCYIICVHR